MSEEKEFKRLTAAAKRMQRDPRFDKLLAASSVGKYVDNGDGIIKLRVSEVREEQAEWDGKVPPVVLRHCANCHSIAGRREGSCGLQGHDYGCPKCDADESF